MKWILAFVSLAGLWAPLTYAAPDEDKLGKQHGYPVGNASTWYDSESVRVGSFTHQAEISGIFRGKPNVLQPSNMPMALPTANRNQTSGGTRRVTPTSPWTITSPASASWG